MLGWWCYGGDWAVRTIVGKEHFPLFFAPFSGVFLPKCFGRFAGFMRLCFWREIVNDFAMVFRVFFGSVIC
jgi:hypothetical protein